MKKIAFHSNQLGLRGTEIALYSYAKYNEEILGNESVILSNQGADMSSLDKFKDRFEVILSGFGSYKDYLLKNNFDYLYTICAGHNSGGYYNEIPTLVHVVFRHNDPYGHKYFYVSDWLAKDQGYDPSTHSIPHICEPLPAPTYNFRKKYSIPNHAIVFGCYGGSTEFNISWVKEEITTIVNKRKDIYFVFMNINSFVDHPQVLFLPGSYDLGEKSSFVNSCDGMIHARTSGETFGLAISEFALSNIPILTWGLSGERSHLEILGDKALTYNNRDELSNILNNFDQLDIPTDTYKAYEQFSPEKIMNKFDKVILQ